MASITTHTCDRCGNSCSAGTYINGFTRNWNNVQVKPDTYGYYDLCEECFQKVLEFVKSPKKDVKEKPVELPKNGPFRTFRKWWS